MHACSMYVCICISIADTPTPHPHTLTITWYDVIILQAVISAHDKIANKEYPLQSVMVAREMTSSNTSVDEESIRIVRVLKGTDPMVTLLP